MGAPSAFEGVNQSDDGESKGTAGKPILNVLLHSGLGNVVCQMETLLFSYQLQGKVEYYLASSDVEITDKIFSQQVCFIIAASQNKVSEIHNDLGQLANGKILITFDSDE